MSRRHRAEPRSVNPDLLYNSELVTRFINQVMERGKKSTAERVIYGAFTEIESKLNQSPVEVFEKAIENVRPQLEVKSRRVGGATYQVPLEVKDGRGRALAMRWIIGNARNKRGVPMAKALANELMDAFNETGSSIKKRDDTHKMAQANKAFAHYRW